MASDREQASGAAVQPGFAASDLATLLGLPFLLTLSWLLPERWWPGFARAVAPLAGPMVAGDPAALPAIIARTIGERASRPASPEAILSGLAAEQVLLQLQLLRGYRPGGWRPEIGLVGRDHVEAARERGQGAILWIAFMVHGDLAAKMAFHRAGFEVHHLSRPSHGFSASRFGIRFLNPIHTRIEDRFLGARVTLAPNDARPALEALARHLRGNAVVSVTARRDAKRPAAVPFLDGEIKLAPGAVILARRTGAALLPTFAFREPSGALKVAIEAPLEVPQEGPGSEAVEAVARRYAEVLAPYALAHAGQWKGWYQL
ncbi:MAG: hypothetical protein QF893_01605 [Alphaproteobacteria bacterium]|jgi:lauroyl/myristoyl acyltransferase|nr:hypothetical protein [Alphaproteobacteria bacterium]